MLAVCDRYPFPARDGETYAIAGQLDTLIEDYDIDILHVLHPGWPPEQPNPALRRWRYSSLCVSQIRPRVARVLGEVLLQRPYFVIPPGPASRLTAVLNGPYDVVYVALERMAPWLVQVRRALGSHPVGVLCVNDAFTERLRYHGALARRDLLPVTRRLVNGMQWLRTCYFGRLERQLLKPFDLVLVQTSKDRDALSHDCGPDLAPRVLVVPNGCKEELRGAVYRGANSRRLLFLGTLDTDQAHLLRWFASQVLTPLLRHVPDATLTIAGSVRSRVEDIIPRSPGIRVVGFVPDLATLMSESAMLVAPSFMRAGLLNKILDAMTAGLPSSGIGAYNGFKGFRDGIHGFPVDSARQWVELLARVLRDPGLLRRVSVESRRLVLQNFSWRDSLSGLRTRLREAICSGARSGVTGRSLDGTKDSAYTSAD